MSVVIFTDDNNNYSYCQLLAVFNDEFIMQFDVNSLNIKQITVIGTFFRTKFYWTIFLVIWKCY